MMWKLTTPLLLLTSEPRVKKCLLADNFKRLFDWGEAQLLIYSTGHIEWVWHRLKTWRGHTVIPVYKVCGSVNGVYYPSGVISQFTPTHLRCWFLPYETERVPHQLKNTVVDAFEKRETHLVSLTHQWAGNFCLRVEMISFSTSWSVSVTMSVDELFSVTALSRCKALWATCKFMNKKMPRFSLRKLRVLACRRKYAF